MGLRYALVLYIVATTFVPGAISAEMQTIPPQIELKRRIEVPVAENGTMQSNLSDLESARDKLYVGLKQERENLKATYKTDYKLKSLIIDGQIFIDLSGTQKIEIVSTSVYQQTPGDAQ